MKTCRVQVGRLYIVKLLNLSKLIFNRLFCRYTQVYLKTYLEQLEWLKWLERLKDDRIVITVLKQRNKFGGITLLGFKTIRTEWYWRMHRHRTWEQIIEPRNRPTSICSTTFLQWCKNNPMEEGQSFQQMVQQQNWTSKMPQNKN